MPESGTCRADLSDDSLACLLETFLLQVEKLEFLPYALFSRQIVELGPLCDGLKYDLQLTLLPILPVFGRFENSSG